MLRENREMLWAKWSKADDNNLARLIKEKCTNGDIANELGRSPLAIISRRAKLGLKVPKKKKIPKVQKYCKAKDCDNPCRMSFCERACERFTNQSYVSESREEYLKRLNKNK